jgi:uncharacterized protein YndB with AHSA1/START domain
MSKLTLKPEGDRFLVVTRRFAAPPEAVYRAHTDPALVQKWLLGPEGWTMPVCQLDPRPGGKIRYEWARGNQGFYLTGEILEMDPPRRIVHVERMFLPDRTPDNHVETLFEPDGSGGTLMLIRMTLPDGATRAQMLATGMEHGMEASYVRLENQILSVGV